MRPYLDKKPSQKRARGEAQVGPEFKPQYSKKKKKKKKSTFLEHVLWGQPPLGSHAFTCDLSEIQFPHL
jgi:hypothetical protein